MFRHRADGAGWLTCSACGTTRRRCTPYVAVCSVCRVNTVMSRFLLSPPAQPPQAARQMPDVGKQSGQRLAAAGLGGLRALWATDPRRIEAVAQRPYPFGKRFDWHSPSRIWHRARVPSPVWGGPGPQTLGAPRPPRSGPTPSVRSTGFRVQLVAPARSRPGWCPNRCTLTHVVLRPLHAGNMVCANPCGQGAGPIGRCLCPFLYRPPPRRLPPRSRQHAPRPCGPVAPCLPPSLVLVYPPPSLLGNMPRGQVSTP